MSASCPRCQRAAAEIDRIMRELMELRASLAPVQRATVPASSAALLDTNELAELLRLHRGTIAKRCQLGLARRHPGVRKPGGRWLATAEAMRDLGP